jgi:3alpha(or 20beta)-hydroxysteroid dehydrogenase
MSLPRLQDKVAIITGAARGQGAAEAQLFVEEGATVIIADILDDAGRALADQLGKAAVYHHLDVGDERGWEDVVRETMTEFHRIDILVNNAAILHMAAIEDTTLEDFQRVIRVNQIGPFLGMRSVIGAMRESGGGSMVNVSSVDGRTGMNGVAAYSATKFAVRALTLVGALELGKYGIRVNTLHPGGVETAMGAPRPADGSENEFFLRHPIPRIGQPREIAQAALFLASDESSYITGAELAADGGQTAGLRVAGAPGY